ncbi:MAG: pyridoxal phosphate-dependent decarboxylase family protein [Acidimicrobiales bacterium]
MRTLLMDAAERSASYLDGLSTRSVAPPADAIAGLAALGGELPDDPTDPGEVLALLDDVGSPATIASAGPRYFGFVIGGSLPAAVAASWLATAWDNNAGLRVASPVGAHLEAVALAWLVDVLGLPEGTGGGFVTGATMANLTGLAAARHALLRRAGWDVEGLGLFGAPELRVVVGDEVHVSLLKALSLLGLGRDRVVRVPVDDQGRISADELPPLDGRTILCVQAGNVNTGAVDPLGRLTKAARAAGAWVHVDGAFGLWAAVAPERRALVEGVDRADSWATDGHKWLNVPYDSGLVFVRDSEVLSASMAATAAYLIPGHDREPYDYTPEMSRRARGLDVWAALRSLGRSGLAALVEGCCVQASRFAAGLSAAGYEVLNDVVLNQVLASFGDDDTTRAVVAAVQDDGTCWCGGTVWQGRAAMRISVSSWATTDDDVEASLDAIIRVASSRSAA